MGSQRVIFARLQAAARFARPSVPGVPGFSYGNSKFVGIAEGGK